MRTLLGCLGLSLSVVTSPLDAEEPARLPATLKQGSVVVDSTGAHGVLTDGTRAELTLDVELQHASTRLLKSAHPLAGAVVMLDVATGNVLAFEQFTRPGKPIYDVLTSEAPTASVFKLVTTTALFEHSDVLPTTSVCFSGGERGIVRRHLEPPARDEARCAPFGTALGFSRNAVYAQLTTQHLMRQQLADVAERLGFNAPLDFDMEASMGTVELPYNDLDFARASAGFRNSSITPLGVAHLTYAVALGGQAGRMRLVREAGDYKAPGGRTLLGQIIPPTIAWRLTRMMEVTVHSGTSLVAFSNSYGSSYLGNIRIAGKTGTLQARRDGPTTSWFTGFAPSRKPKVVVTVLLQNGEVWRAKANELARDLLRVYFRDQRGVTSPFDEPNLARAQHGG